MIRRTMALCFAIVLAFSLAACGSGNSGSSASPSGSAPASSPAASASSPAASASSPAASASSPAASASGPVEKLNLNPTTVEGVGPNGESAASPSELTLTDEEKQKLKDGKFTAAFVYHMQSNEHNQLKLAAAKKVLEDLGVKIVSVTDANQNTQTQISNIETTMALKPDVMIAMPYDPEATAPMFRKVQKSGTKLVFMENVPKGFKPGSDYVSLINSDSYGNGKTAALIMAQQIGYKGEVAMDYFNTVFFTTNERDRGFKETIAKFPDIKLVAESGFTEEPKAGEVADGLLANHPNLKGIYASWDGPAEAVVASAKSAGRNDLVVTTVDLSVNTAISIASDGIIRGTAATRSIEQGQAEAMAAAYALLGKKAPPYICPPALPVVKENVLQSYQIAYQKDAPKEVIDAYNKHNK